MDGFDNMEWLEAVMSHPATEDIDVDVAIGVLLTGSANGVTRKGPKGPVLINPEDVDDSIVVLTELGFLEPLVSVGADHLLRLAMPKAANA
jgi:hypothetical protein